MTPAPRTYGWRSWKDVGREGALAAVLGVIVTLIESGGTDEFPPGHTFVRNMIIATTIMIVGRLLETLLSWAIEQSRMPIVFRSVLYALGGWFGFFLGIGLAAMVLGEQEDDFSLQSYSFMYSLTVAALMSILVGFVLHHNRKRNDRLHKNIARLKEHEFAEKELEIARSMQKRLLPPPEIEGNGFHVSARSEAAHIVGGDFYDVLELSDGSTAIVVADASGKGIAASLLMASCKAMIPFLAAGREPAEVAAALNEKLCADLGRREFVALLYARLDPASGRLEMVNAGMPEPLIVRNGKPVTVAFTGDRYPLGLRRGNSYVSTVETLGPGDCALFFSDGLAEAMSGDDPVGYEKVGELAEGYASIDALLAKVHGLPSLQIHDDLTVVALERRPFRKSSIASV